MSLVIYDGTDGLIDKLGHWFGLVQFLVASRQDVIDAIDASYAAYGADELYLTAPIDAIRQSLARAGLDPAVVASHSVATRTLIDVVNAAIPLPAATVRDALIVLREQMILEGDTVKASATSASAAYQGTPAGDGTMIFPTIGQLAHTQDITARCVRDQYTGALKGAELFEVTAPAPKPDPYSLAWGTGTGYGARIAAFDYLARGGIGSAPGMQMLRNGAWDYPGAGPDEAIAPEGWTAVADEGMIYSFSDSITGTNCMWWFGTAELEGRPVIRQNLDGAAGGVQLVPNATHLLGFWIKRASTGPSGGTFTLEVIGDGDTPIATVTVADAALTTDWVLHYVSFATTDIMPAAPYVLLSRKGSDLQNGQEVFLSCGFLAIPHSLGTGQAEATLAQYLIVPGPTQFRNGDTIIGSISNNRGGEVQMWFDRFFATARLGIVLPYSDSPTIPDSVIPSP